MRRRHALPERFVLFVGTLEPRKNLRASGGRAAPASTIRCRSSSPGPTDGAAPSTASAVDVRFLGFVAPDDLGRRCTPAATVFAYPSEEEGFGLPVAEAMAQGTPVVTSRGTSTEEVAGGAAVLVDPLDVDAIAAGLAGGRAARGRAGAGRPAPGPPS